MLFYILILLFFLVLSSSPWIYHNVFIHLPVGGSFPVFFTITNKSCYKHLRISVQIFITILGRREERKYTGWCYERLNSLTTITERYYLLLLNQEIEESIV